MIWVVGTGFDDYMVGSNEDNQRYETREQRDVRRTATDSVFKAAGEDRVLEARRK